jgi:hypothetical protein
MDDRIIRMKLDTIRRRAGPRARGHSPRGGGPGPVGGPAGG